MRRNGRQGVAYLLEEGMTVLDPHTMDPVPWDGETMGEIMFRGNITMKGYLKNPKATEEAFRGGWFHSGDLAVMQPDGYVKIKDRSKDVIISGGENISSQEVEDVLFGHPAVMLAAVVAQPDPKWGETPCAFVELKEGASATEAEIIEFCRERMARFKVPRSVVFGPLPKTSTGKIQKFLLRERGEEPQRHRVEPAMTHDARRIGALPGPHGFHRMRWVEWGDRDNPRVLVCAHGLTRCGRDFDYLAERMADAYRVVCPDIAGRGRSDWLADKADYGYPVYCADIAAMLAAIGAESVDWVGTSMGGILGMLLAAHPRTPVGKLVLNDVGCVVPKAALERIATYVGRDPAFESLEALEAAMRSVSPFGSLTPAQWGHLAIHVARRDAAGKWRFRYDPGIAAAFKAGPLADVDLRAVLAGRARAGPRRCAASSRTSSRRRSTRRCSRGRAPRGSSCPARDTRRC